tara:strand:+ start:99 stop:665 length:567 start_codon:yes stop_codon:yes gene_type:complete
VLLSYVFGTLPSAHFVARRRGFDPTKTGSGNPGATNVYRVVGRQAGLVVFCADVGKGALAAVAGLIIDGRPLGMACWVAAVVGHVFPLTRRLRGGKGVATAGGGSWVLFPLEAACCLILFALVAKSTKKASIASLVIAATLPILVMVLGAPLEEVLISMGIAGLVVIRHQSNIRRLIAGSEETWRAKD